MYPPVLCASRLLAQDASDQAMACTSPSIFREQLRDSVSSELSQDLVGGQQGLNSCNSDLALDEIHVHGAVGSRLCH